MLRNKTQEANMAATSMESTDSKTEAKIDEKEEIQATEIRNQCEQLREDAITSLQREVTQLKRDVATLEEKNEDLEGRSRWCNLGIIVVK